MDIHDLQERLDHELDQIVNKRLDFIFSECGSSYEEVFTSSSSETKTAICEKVYILKRELHQLFDAFESTASTLLLPSDKSPRRQPSKRKASDTNSRHPPLIVGKSLAASDDQAHVPDVEAMQAAEIAR